MKFNIVGIQRSGTFYTSSLIEKNFGLTQNNPDSPKDGQATYKHSIKPFEMTCSTFVIYKPIYHWLESIIFRQAQFARIIENTLKHDESRYVHATQEIRIGKDTSLNKLVNLYRQFYENWVLDASANNRQYLFAIRYSDLLTETSRVETLKKIKRRFGFLKTDAYVNSDWGDVSFSREPFRKKEGYQTKMEHYYLNQPKGNQLDDEQIRVVDEIIDPAFRSLLAARTDSCSPGESGREHRCRGVNHPPETPKRDKICHPVPKVDDALTIRPIIDRIDRISQD